MPEAQSTAYSVALVFAKIFSRCTPQPRHRWLAAAVARAVQALVVAPSPVRGIRRSAGSARDILVHLLSAMRASQLEEDRTRGVCTGVPNRSRRMPHRRNPSRCSTGKVIMQSHADDAVVVVRRGRVGHHDAVVAVHVGVQRSSRIVDDPKMKSTLPLDVAVAQVDTPVPRPAISLVAVMRHS